MRVKLLDMQRDFYLSALREAEASAVKGYVFTTKYDRSAGSKFIENLLRHKIEVYRCARISHPESTYQPADSYFVPAKQKEYRFVRSLFETVKTFADTVFYDISTWTMPIAFNLSFTPLNGAEAAGMAGEKVTAPPFPAGSLTGNGSDYAWLFEWSDTYAPKALYMIQKAGLTARIATAPFTTVMPDGKKKSFGYGTVMVQQGENAHPAGEVAEILKKLQKNAA